MSTGNADYITNSLKKWIEDYKPETDYSKTGTVISNTDGVVGIDGLDGCKSMEILEFPNNIFGLALNLEKDNVGVIIIGLMGVILDRTLVLAERRIVHWAGR